MELWELTARESIRDLVARYNANGDTGRFPQVLELFAPDAVMEVPGGVYEGTERIETTVVQLEIHGSLAVQRGEYTMLWSPPTAVPPSSRPAST